MASDSDTDLDIHGLSHTQAIAEIQALRARNAELRGHLNSAGARIMLLHGDFDQITDGEVGKGFESLRRAIDHWVQKVDVAYGDSDDFQETFLEEFQGKEQVRLIQHLDLKDGTGISTWDRKLQWVSQFITCTCVVLSRLIWSHLYNEIFRPDYPLGLDDVVTKGYAYLIDAIKRDGNGKDIKEPLYVINKRRAESMKMLVSTKKFQKDKDLDVQDCRERLYQKLLQRPVSLKAEILRKYFPLLETTVLYPAIELKQAIACSSTVFGFIEPKDPLELGHVVPFEDTTSGYYYDIKDVATWRRQHDFEGTSGIFCCLFPGVYIKEAQQSDNLSVTKPFVLTYDKEAERQLLSSKERNPNKTTKHSFQGPSSSSRLSSSKEKIPDRTRKYSSRSPSSSSRLSSSNIGRKRI